MPLPLLPSIIRRLALTLHVVVSVGWIGAAASVSVLGFLALNSGSYPATRGALLVMEPLARYVLLPLALASLISGVVQSLGTPWGLLRHYRVLLKPALTTGAAVFLLMYLPTFGALADAAARPSATPDELSASALSPVLHGTATLLAVLKPRGRTPLAAAARPSTGAPQPERPQSGSGPGPGGRAR